METSALRNLPSPSPSAARLGAWHYVAVVVVGILTVVFTATGLLVLREAYIVRERTNVMWAFLNRPAEQAPQPPKEAPK